MNFRALFKYTLDTNVFNIVISVLSALFLGVFWAIIVFATFGNVFGYIGFRTFKNNEYYAYYNLGFSKLKLLMSTFIVNLFIGVFLMVLYLIFKI
jgi:hypothetical protein